MRLIAIGCGLMLLAGCGRGAQTAPAVCFQDPVEIEEALTAAPHAVLLGEEQIRISDCIKRAASSDQLQAVGTSLLTAAQYMADRAREHRGARLHRGYLSSLGYVIGAARNGEKRSASGGELARRLDQEADGLRGSAAFQRGLRAGLAKG